MIKKPLFWNNINLISLSLIPISIITLIVNFLKNLFLKKKYKIKTICVGNIYIGGTGKTSLCIEINNILKKKFRTVFIKKNYASQIDEQNILKLHGNLINLKSRDLSLRAAKKRNLLTGLHNGTAEYAQKMLSKGFDLVTVGSDSRYIAAGAKSDLERLKSIKGSKSKGY